MRTLLPLIWLVLAALPLAQGSQFVLSSQDRARLLAVDFVATTADGTPVTDLRADELHVRVGSRPRTVRSLDYVRTAADPAARDVPPPFGDNAEPGRARSVIFIIDEDTIRPGRTLDIRDGVQQVLQGLGGADRAALVTVPFGGLAVDLTTDHPRLLQAVSQITAKSSRAESLADAQCRTFSTLTAVTDLLLRLSQVEDPVTVVFFSSHQEAPQSIIRMTGSAPITGPCDLRATTFTDLGAAAARARAQFFVVHADFEQRGRGLEGLEHLTGVTGAPLLHLVSGGGRAATDRILTQTRGHYLARVSRDPADTPGEVLDITVHVSRPGVTIWRAPRLLITRPPAATAPLAPASLTDIMRQPGLSRDLPLRIAGHVFRQDSDRVRVAVTLDSPDGAAELSEAIIGLFDPSGRLAAGVDMNAAALTSRPIVAALDAPPGVYRLRAAVRESSGRVGSVDVAVDAQLTRVATLSTGSLMLGLSRDGAFIPMLALTTEPTAFALIELYGEGAGRAAVTFEVAPTLNGPAVMTMPGRLEASPDPTRIVVTAALPIQRLAPGDHVVRAIITPDGQPSGRVVRALRKSGS